MIRWFPTRHAPSGAALALSLEQLSAVATHKKQLLYYAATSWNTTKGGHLKSPVLLLSKELHTAASPLKSVTFTCDKGQRRAVQRRTALEVPEQARACVVPSIHHLPACPLVKCFRIMRSVIVQLCCPSRWHLPEAYVRTARAHCQSTSQLNLHCRTDCY